MFKTLFSNWGSSLKRFSITIFLLVLGLILSIYLVEISPTFSSRIEDFTTQFILQRVIIGVYVMVILSIGVRVFLERIKYVFGANDYLSFLQKKIGFEFTNFIINVFCLILVSIIVFFLSNSDYFFSLVASTGYSDFYDRFARLSLLFPVAILFLLASPITTSKWWDYFFKGLQGALIGILFAIVFFVGTGGALLAIDIFFEFELLGQNQYLYIALIAFSFIAPVLLINKISEVSADSDVSELKLPKFLENLQKWIFVPLLAIYSLILTIYIFSLPFGDWPANQSTTFVSIFLIIGYWGLFFLQGFVDKQNLFTRTYKFAFNIAAIALTIFWIYSLWIRIDAYGITFIRIIAFILLIWIVLWSFIHIFSNKLQFPLQFFSGSILIFILAFMPLSVNFWTQLSLERSFRSNLEEIQSQESSKWEEEYQLYSQAKYINKYFGLDNIISDLDEDTIERLEILDSEIVEFYLDQKLMDSNSTRSNRLDQSDEGPGELLIYSSEEELELLKEYIDNNPGIKSLSMYLSQYNDYDNFNNAISRRNNISQFNLNCDSLETFEPLFARNVDFPEDYLAECDRQDDNSSNIVGTPNETNYVSFETCVNVEFNKQTVNSYSLSSNIENSGEVELFSVNNINNSSVNIANELVGDLGGYDNLIDWQDQVKNSYFGDGKDFVSNQPREKCERYVTSDPDLLKIENTETGEDFLFIELYYLLEPEEENVTILKAEGIKLQ